MIRETLNKKRAPALTSDRWHVIHSRWDGVDESVAHFQRTIVSEHESGTEASVAARTFWGQIAPTLLDRAGDRRDQVLVRRPDYRSLKRAKRVKRRQV